MQRRKRRRLYRAILYCGGAFYLLRLNFTQDMTQEFAIPHRSIHFQDVVAAATFKRELDFIWATTWPPGLAFHQITVLVIFAFGEKSEVLHFHIVLNASE